MGVTAPRKHEGAIRGALWGCDSWSGVGYPRDAVGEEVPLASARVIDAGLGKMVGSRGELLLDPAADMMLGSWMPPLGLVGPYDPADPGGETERSSCSRIGEGIEVWRTGECPLVEDPDETEVVRFRRLLP